MMETDPAPEGGNGETADKPQADANANGQESEMDASETPMNQV